MRAAPKRRPAWDVVEPIYDIAGLPVEVRNGVWFLNYLQEARRLDWSLYSFLSPALFEATVAYMRSVVETKSARFSRNTFYHLSMIGKSETLRTASANGSAIPISIFTDLLRRDRNDNYNVHYVRKWYRWCAAHEYAGFDPDVAFEATRIRIGGNAKGSAVLSVDPERGPLTDLEVAGLLNSMRAARRNGVLTIQEQVALWLCVAFGSNPQQLSLLRVEDVKFEIDAESGAKFAQISIPRMKKREATVRSSYRKRRLTTEISTLLEDLLLAEGAAYEAQRMDHYARPIFRRLTARRDLVGTPVEEYAMHLSSQEFSQLVAGAISKLNVTSHRTGKPLRLTPRRFRYTFATRLVREGVPKREVADLLDHTDLQHVEPRRVSRRPFRLSATRRSGRPQAWRSMRLRPRRAGCCRSARAGGGC